MGLVANAGPLIALARIGKLELLSAAYAEVLVPDAVYREVTQDPLMPGAHDVAKAHWLRSAPVTDSRAVARMRFWLDEGESEAIVLAQDRAVPLAIDERRGRRIAESLGIDITGTVGILLTCKGLGLIDEVMPLLDQLIHKGVRLSVSLLRERSPIGTGSIGGRRASRSGPCARPPSARSCYCPAVEAGRRRSGTRRCVPGWRGFPRRRADDALCGSV